MSGTSLDGLDIALVKISLDNAGQWNFDLVKAETVEYADELKESLSKSTHAIEKDG